MPHRADRSLLAALVTTAIAACSPTPRTPLVATRPPAPAPAPAPAAASLALAVAPGASQGTPPRAPGRDELPALGPRVASLRYPTWIYAKPSRKSAIVGYVRPGTSVALAAPDSLAGAGCARGFSAVVPRGFVCNDAGTTHDLDDPLVRAHAASPQDARAVLPFHYAISLGAPMYGRVPTEDEQAKVEGARPPARPSSRPSAHEELATADPIEPTDEVPEVVREGRDLPSFDHDTKLVRKWVPAGSMVAYRRAFRAAGRVWVLSTDLRLVPADRVRAFRESTFEGVKLGGDVRLPLAWARHRPVERYRREGDAMIETGEPIAPRSFVALGTASVRVGGRVYLESARAGVYVADDEVAIARAREAPPAVVKEGEKWLEIHLRAGTLTAYEGATPVFTTLASPGAGGVPPAGASDHDLVVRSATPLGVYRVAWKIRASVMTPETGDPQKFWIADVPYALYFRAPFAIHGAYWHEDFGVFKSAGCVNTSPRDGRFLFDWSAPALPADWQGVGPGPGDPSTRVVILP